MPVYGDMVLIQRADESARRAERLSIGSTNGRDEAWLRNLIAEHPEILPVHDVDPSFAPLTTLCTELRTEAGPVDVALISPAGRLAIVECKLWRNPEARRKVVAQVLDYARALARWTYADLQRQVSAAAGSTGNLPFEAAKRMRPDIEEAQFIDATTRSLREGRFLLLIAGDGIREGVSGIAELINRNAAMGFSFGLIEVALYGLADGGMIVQPRVVARTETIERTFVRIETAGTHESLAEVDSETNSEPVTEQEAITPKSAEYRQWWEPITRMTFDDPEQPPPVYRHPNHVRVELVDPKIWLTCYRLSDRRMCGVLLNGKFERLEALIETLGPAPEALLEELPTGSKFGMSGLTRCMTFQSYAAMSEFGSDDEIRAWLMRVINRFATVFRPRIKAMIRSEGGKG